MAFASLDDSHEDAPVAEINMVPLIDVMLVLLIVFMVTAPLLTHAVKVDLPKAASTPNLTKPDTIELAIDNDSRLFWNGEVIDPGDLAARLRNAAERQPQADLHIRAERRTPYEKVAQVMSEASAQGITRIGFVTDPRAPH